MSIVNRRNAVVGWAVVKLGKRAARKKAQGAVPTRGTIAGAIAALGGMLVFWRKKRGAGSE